jgi:IS30 family transposase
VYHESSTHLDVIGNRDATLKDAKALDAEMYFAHPYASYERGLNENTNGLLRQFIPTGTDLRTVSEEDLQRYQGALNNRPRKCLGFRQPSVVFAELRKAA